MWNPETGKIEVWNSESWALESGIQHKDSGILLTIGIRNPSSTDEESGIHSVESNPRLPWISNTCEGKATTTKWGSTGSLVELTAEGVIEKIKKENKKNGELYLLDISVCYAKL